MPSRPLPPPPSASRYAPIMPLPVTDQCHYLRRSDDGHLISQSESSMSNSDLDESDVDEETAVIPSHDANDSDSDSDSDAASSASEDSSGASLSSRSASESSLYDSENPSFTVDELKGISFSAATTMYAPRNGGSAYWQSDNLGVLALLIPISGVSTMAVTEILACANHFDCTKEYPTLSYAAQFKPEGHAFTLGMCMTAMFILVSMVLFHWFLRLKLFHPGVARTTIFVTHVCLVFGVLTAVSLSGLAVFDMGAYHDAHVQFTVTFFASAWVMMIAIQLARRKLLREQEETRLQKKTSCSSLSDGASAMGRALQRWKRMSQQSAYQIGHFFLFAGLGATGLFGLLYLCVNGMWPNPLGFTAVQEALLEAFAILCQLFFMGTLSCELSKLTRVVEHRDYEELERAD